MPTPWACAAVVFRDSGKVFRFPLERPNPPVQRIKREFRERGVNVDNDDAFLEFLIKGFVEYLRKLEPENVKPDAPSSATMDLAMWLMVITKIANTRYWAISVTDKLVIYQPIFGRSLNEGVALIESVIADPKRMLPGNITIH